MKNPSIKTLRAAFGDKAGRLRNLMIRPGYASHPVGFPKTAAWRRACLNPPSTLELQLRSMDEWLEGYGVEFIRAGESSDDPIVAEYINMGETYAVTILYNHISNRFEVTSWGDWVEWAEKKGIIKRED